MAKKNIKPVQNEITGYTYLGPSFRGVIQYGTFYTGTRESVEAELFEAIKKYPQIREMLVSDDNFAHERVLIKTPGTLQNKIYKILAKHTENK